MSTHKTLLVTGGAGFIGSNFVRRVIRERGVKVVNLDKLTYSGNLENLAELEADPGYVFVRGDVGDRALVDSLLARHEPDAVVHFAAESHVDRSIDEPLSFVETNVLGTFTLLEAARAYMTRVSESKKTAFRFLHVSTDEVYGSLGSEGFFTERSVYAPNSPYAASKAGSDHFVRAYFHTYRVPTLTTHCSNNYGPYQFPEKLIPLMILNALEGRPLPVYGDGLNVRDWIFVEDHCDALLSVLERGAPGATYTIGSRSERTNLELVRGLCAVLDELAPMSVTGSEKQRTYLDLMTFVQDRPGHDRRYAIDPTRIENELGWRPRTTFEQGLRATVRWYLEHRDWCRRITTGVYRRTRLGLGGAAPEVFS